MKTIQQLKEKYEAAKIAYEMCDAPNAWDSSKEKMQDAKQKYERALGISSVEVRRKSISEQMAEYKARRMQSLITQAQSDIQAAIDECKKWIPKESQEGGAV